MGKADIDLEKKPFGFIVCYNEDCSLKENCLRGEVAELNQEEDDVLKVVNSAKFSGENCKFYLENKKVLMAYGMKKSFDKVLAKDIAEIRKTLNAYFGHGSYYVRRNGEKAINPTEQAYIASIFAKYGYEITFDRLVEETLWE
jgi:hypothetical protein